jgi:hypothetical protein
MKTVKSYLVIVELAQRSQNMFPNLSFLDSKKIQAIQVLNSSQTSLSPDGRTVASSDITNQGFLNLTSQGVLWVENMPLQLLIPSSNNGAIREFSDLLIDSSKCYVNFPTPASLIAGEVVLINFFYID